MSEFPIFSNMFEYLWFEAAEGEEGTEGAETTAAADGEKQAADGDKKDGDDKKSADKKPSDKKSAEEKK